MKKTYQKPIINIVRINTELPMASSAFVNIVDDGTTITGSEALGNMEGGLDIWGNRNANIW